MTSLAFMLVEVPAPPWIMSTMNCSCSRPARMSLVAAMIASAFAGSSAPMSRLACAAACFTAASAPMKIGYIFRVIPVIGKFSTARTVCTP